MSSRTNDTHSLAVGYLLWIFGFTGSHRFYFGKPITGTIWFFTLGLLGVGWLIDLLLMPGLERSAEARFQAGPSDYTLAWVLLTFLGLFGAHRFYLGNSPRRNPRLLGKLQRGWLCRGRKHGGVVHTRSSARCF